MLIFVVPLFYERNELERWLYFSHDGTKNVGIRRSKQTPAAKPNYYLMNHKVELEH